MTETPRPVKRPGKTTPRRILTPAEARELIDLFVECGTAEARYDVANRSGEYTENELGTLRKAAADLQDAMFRWVRDRTDHGRARLQPVPTSAVLRSRQQDKQTLIDAYLRGELRIKRDGLIAEATVKAHLAPCGTRRARAAQEAINGWITARRQS